MIIFGLIAIAIIAGAFFTSDNSNQNVQSVTPTPYYTNEEYYPTPKIQGTNDTSSFSSPFIEDYYDSNQKDIEEKKSQADDLISKIQDLDREISRLKRNADSYSHDDFSSKLKKLQDEAGGLSQEASDLSIDDATQSLDDVSYNLKGLRNEINSDPSFFYREREDEIDSKLKKSIWNTDDAESYVDDYSFDLDDY